MTVFDFHVGHDKPESKGGTLDIENLKPICARRIFQFSDNYTIQEWSGYPGKERKDLVVFKLLFF